jgi:hypothetical protein
LGVIIVSKPDTSTELFSLLIGQVMDPSGTHVTPFGAAYNTKVNVGLRAMDFAPPDGVKYFVHSKITTIGAISAPVVIGLYAQRNMPRLSPL